MRDVISYRIAPLRDGLQIGPCSTTINSMNETPRPISTTLPGLVKSLQKELDKQARASREIARLQKIIDEAPAKIEAARLAIAQYQAAPVTAPAEPIINSPNDAAHNPQEPDYDPGYPGYANRGLDNQPDY